MLYPSSTKLNWLEMIRRISPFRLSCIFALIYFVITGIFALLYYHYVPLTDHPKEQITQEETTSTEAIASKDRKTFFDSIYFSVVTGTTLGFGDYAPKNPFGKFIAIVHVLLATVFFALVVSFTFLKLLHPRGTLIFSKKMVYNKRTNSLTIRLINVSRSKLINPEIRVVMGIHTTRHGISQHKLIKKMSDLPVLGNHDFQFTLHDLNNEIIEQIEIARKYNKDKETYDEKSRFRIKISITGTYAYSQYSQYQKYSESDFAFGKGFQNIEYPEEFHKKRRKYSAIPNFWQKFNSSLS